MKKKLTLICLLLMGSLNPHRAQAEIVFLFPIYGFYVSGQLIGSLIANTINGIKNSSTFAKVSVVSTVAAWMAGAYIYDCLGNAECFNGALIGVVVNGLGLAAYAAFKACHDYAYKELLAIAIRGRDIEQLKRLCEEIFTSFSTDYYAIAVYIEFARNEVQKITDQSAKRELLAVVIAYEERNAVAYTRFHALESAGLMPKTREQIERAKTAAEIEYLVASDIRARKLEHEREQNLKKYTAAPCWL